MEKKFKHQKGYWKNKDNMMNEAMKYSTKASSSYYIYLVWFKTINLISTCQIEPYIVSNIVYSTITTTFFYQNPYSKQICRCFISHWFIVNCPSFFVRLFFQNHSFFFSHCLHQKPTSKQCNVLIFKILYCDFPVDMMVGSVGIIGVHCPFQ